MELQQRRSEPEELKRLGEEIEQWRKGRTKLRPMPAPLWDRAASIARSIGINPVAQALRLNYQALKEKTSPAPHRPKKEGASRAPTPVSPGHFIELSNPPLARVPAHQGVVEVVAPDGARLIIRLPNVADIGSLVDAFRAR